MSNAIAIVGIGLRMPPGAGQVGQFWQSLVRGVDGISRVQFDRWDERRFFDPDKSRPGKTYVAEGGFLQHNMREFDPLVFGISPREAQGLDPQQRLLLESSWEAWEDAGVPVDELEGSPTGVFVGGFCLDHLLHINHPDNRHLARSHSATSASMTMLANRLSYIYNLAGPSFTLDTACSSSLVAVDCAVRALQRGDCTMALAGGVNAMMRPDFPIIMSKGQFLSDHGRCRTFDEGASGYVRGEGCGVIVLRPLAEAQARGDQIYAVIEATGTNQDGRTDGITLPNTHAQEALIGQVLKQAALEPAQIDYVEAHGTGTQAGDKAESRALGAAYGADRTGDDRLWVGSVKTNIGHLEAAAGVAGIIKAALVLKNRQIPRNLHFDTPNPAIDFDALGIRVPTTTETLPTAEEKEVLYAAVNSFGYGGTNAHAILSTPPPPVERKSPALPKEKIPFPVSAKSPEALLETAGRLAFALRKTDEKALPDVFHTLARRRAHHPHRLAVSASSLKELRGGLKSASAGEVTPHLTLSEEPCEVCPRPVFVFTGMGPQWWAMGRELFTQDPIGKATLKEIDAAFGEVAGWSLTKELLAEESASRVTQTDIAQPANFAIQIALARRWQAWGIEPSVVIGHSVGEVSSAYLAGVYSLEDAVLVSYHRSRLQYTTAHQGGMLAVGLPEEEALAYVAKVEGVSVAAVNSFSSVTLSGEMAGLKAIAAELEAAEIFHRFLRVEVAYHSPQMDPLEAELLDVLSGLQPQTAQLPLYSTVTGERSPGPEWNAEYWWRNVRQPVRFAQGVQAILGTGERVFLEVGPHPVLGNAIKEVATGESSPATTVPSLRRKEPDFVMLHAAQRQLFTAGVAMDWDKLGPESGRFLPMPPYPWQRKPYWLESATSEMERCGLPGPVYQNQRRAGAKPVWDVEINERFFPFLPDHRVQERTVFPGMGYAEAALFLGHTLLGGPGIRLRDVAFARVLIIDPAVQQHLVSSYDPSDGLFEIGCREEGKPGDFQLHARGRLSSRPEQTAASAPELTSWQTACRAEVALSVFQEKLRRRGLYYGPTFSPTTSLHIGERRFLAQLAIDDTRTEGGHLAHPTILDAALQPVLFLARGDGLFVPTQIDAFTLAQPVKGRAFYALGELTREEASILVADVWLLNEAGELLVEMKGITCQSIATETGQSDEADVFIPGWQQVETEEETTDETVSVAILRGETIAPDQLQRLTAGLSAQTVEPSSNWEETLATIPADASLVYVYAEADTPDYANIEAAQLDFLDLLQALQQQKTPRRLTLLRLAQAEDPTALPDLAGAGLSAQGLVAQNEVPHLQFDTLVLGAQHETHTAAPLAAHLARPAGGEFAVFGEQLWERTLPRQRLTPAAVDKQTTTVETPVELVRGQGQGVDGLTYALTERQEPGPDEVEIRVASSALNYKDLLKIYGRLHHLAYDETFIGPALGIEVAGEIIRVGAEAATKWKVGEQVAAVLPHAFRSYATFPAKFLLRSPEKTAFEAASIPVAFMTACHGLETMARLQPGERVLIHQATGSLGNACIQVAQAREAVIFATAGSQAKRQVLQDGGLTHVYPSRDLSFVEAIRAATEGEGLDVVIGALDGEAQREALSLLKPGGRFIDVGKRDIVEDHSLPLRAFNRNLTYAAIDVDRLLVEQPAYIQGLLQGIEERFANGTFTMPPCEVFPAQDFAGAFAQMAQSRHVGKILLDFRNGEVEAAPSSHVPGAIRPDGAYLITGGTGGFGLETAQWLARRGAGRIVLLSRRGKDAPGLAPVLELLAHEGSDVVVVTGDTTAAASLSEVRAQMSCDGFRPAGIFHAAMVLDDALLQDVTPAQFQRVFRPKVAGALQLAETFADADLDFFVSYSSISSIIGNPGQLSYVAANACLDALAQRLRQTGMPGMSLNWGPLTETGVVARSETLATVLDASGIEGLSNSVALTTLERALAADLPQVGIFAVEWGKWSEAFPKLAADTRFRRHVAGAGLDGESEARQAFKAELEALSPADQLALLEARIRAPLANVLKMAADEIPAHARLNDLGIDSLMIVELGLRMEEATTVSFSAMDFLKGPSVRDLTENVRKRLFGD